MVNRFLDTAFFYDAGKVTARTEDLDFDGLKSDYGFGVRFHGPFATPLRVELARSNEGLRLVFATSAALLRLLPCLHHHSRHVSHRASLADCCRSSRSACSPAPSRPRRPHFYNDDPIAREPESQDASKAQPYEIGSLYEMTYNLFVTAGYKPSGMRAQNINTIDEVPDSSWFTNRIGTTGHRRADRARPDRRRAARSLALGADQGENVRRPSGLHGAETRKGETWFLEFDPPYFPEGATGAVAVATKIFWALGYNQVESFLTTFDPKNVDDRPEGDDSSPVRQADAVHAGRHQRDPRARRARTPTAPTAWSPAGCCPARSSAVSCTQAPVPTIPTTSSRTSIAASCARCVSSARGRTSRTSRRRIRSTRSSPRTAARS